MDGDAAPRHVLHRPDVVTAGEEQRARIDRRGLRHAEDAPAHVFRCQRRAQALVRHQVAGEIVELDHCGAAQQLGEQQLAAFLVVGRKGGLRAALRRGKGGDQFAKIRLARPHHVRPHMEHRRYRQTGADGGGEDCGQRRRAVGLARETELGQQVLKQRQRRFGLRAAGCVREGKRTRVEHAEHARGGIVAGRRHQAAVGTQIGLACQSAEHRQMLVTRRIEQHRRMPGRGIGAHPILGAGVVAFPQRGPRERAHQRRLRDILNPCLARAGSRVAPFQRCG